MVDRRDVVVKSILLLVVVMAIAGCALTPEQEAWNRANGIGQVCWTCTPGTISSGPRAATPSVGKDSATLRIAGDDAPRESAMPDLSRMSCSGSSTVSTGTNAGSMSSSTSCRN